MITNPDVAARISALMLDIGAKLDASVAEVMATCPEPEFVEYRRAVGKIMGGMLLEVMDPLYAARPSSKPRHLE